MSAPRDLQALLDREAIRDCLYRYCRGVDRADEAALRSVYWEDGTDCHGAWRGSAAGFIEHVLQHVRSGGRRAHQVTNISIELRDGLAAVESNFVAFQAAAGATVRALICGRYVDQFERREGEWRIAARTVVYDWIEETEYPAIAGDEDALFGSRKPVGCAAPQDPWYVLLRELNF